MDMTLKELITCTIIIKDTITLSFTVSQYVFEIYNGKNEYRAVVLKPSKNFNPILISLLDNYLNLLKLECEIKIVNNTPHFITSTTTNIKLMSKCKFDSKSSKGFFIFENEWKENYFKIFE